MIELVLKYLTYVAVIIFVVRIAWKWRYWSSMPVHLRWELYPVPHEEPERAEYGGGYLEESNWWLKERPKNMIGELKETLTEMLFLKRVYMVRKGLWILTFMFHFGLYLILVWFALLFLSALTRLVLGIEIPPVKYSSLFECYWALFLYWASLITGGVGGVMAFMGCLGLTIRRAVFTSLRNYTTWPEFLNNVIVLLPLITGIVSWALYDPTFNLARTFMTSLISPIPPPPLPPLVTAHLILLLIAIAYIPFTKMSHFIGKYFTYHKVLWDDEPNFGQLTARLNELLRLNIYWSAPHVKQGANWESNVKGV